MSQSFSARVWCRLSLFLWAPLCKTKKHIASQAKQVCTIEDFLTTRLCQVCSQPCTESCYSSARSYRPKIITDVYLSQRILSTPKHQENLLTTKKPGLKIVCTSAISRRRALWLCLFPLMFCGLTHELLNCTSNGGGTALLFFIDVSLYLLGSGYVHFSSLALHLGCWFYSCHRENPQTA